MIKLIDTDPNLFYRRVILSNDSENIYFKIPIFYYIPPQGFVCTFIDAKPSTRDIVCYAIAERYKFDEFNSTLLSELEWLKSVVKLLGEKSQSLKGKISGYQIQLSIDNYFIPAVEKLKQCKVDKERRESVVGRNT